MDVTRSDQEATTVQPRSGRVLPFWLLIIANYIAWIGSVTTLVAVPIYVLETTGSALDAGLAGTANTLPLVVGGIAGGALVDRIGPRIGGVLAGFLAAVCVAAIPLVHSVAGLPFWILLALLFCRGLFDTPTVAARLSLLARLADDAGITRDTANALFQAGQRVALVAGPPIAALLISTVGSIATLYIDALAFALAATLLLVAAPSHPHRRSSTPESLLRQTIGGLAIIVKDRRLSAMVRVFLITNLIEDAFAPVLLPVYARDVLHAPVQVSVPIMAFGIGALLGTLVYIPLARRVPSRFLIFVGSFVVIALARAAMLLEPDVLGLAALSLVIGVASGPLNPIITIVIQNTVPEAALGRTFGALISIAFAAVPLGIFLAGVLISWLGLHATLLVYALAYVAVLVQILRSRSLRDI